MKIVLSDRVFNFIQLHFWTLGTIVDVPVPNKVNWHWRTFKIGPFILLPKSSYSEAMKNE